MTAPTLAPPAARPRATWRAVAVPNEHGGWGLTAEPALLGLLLAPSVAGLLLGLAALVAFVARTPTRVLLVDGYRQRQLARTRVAAGILVAELVLLAALAGAAVATASAPFWWPLVGAAPLVALELWFDMRSRSRRLAPELAGAIGVCAVAAMVLAADGQPTAVGLAAWLVLAGRATTSIPAVRARIASLHGRTTAPAGLLAADLAAVAAAVAATVTEPRMALGAAAVVAVVALQRLPDRQPIRPKVLGFRQMGFGFGVVALTALGFHLL